jgi:hypothetical protein
MPSATTEKIDGGKESAGVHHHESIEQATSPSNSSAVVDETTAEVDSNRDERVTAKAWASVFVSFQRNEHCPGLFSQESGTTAANIL